MRVSSGATVLAVLTSTLLYGASEKPVRAAATEGAKAGAGCSYATGVPVASLLREYEIRRVPGAGPPGLQGPVGGTEPGLPVAPNAADYARQYDPPATAASAARVARPRAALQRKYVENVKRHPGSRRYYYQKAELPRLIARAFSIDARHILYSPKWIAKTRYEIYYETAEPDCDFRLLLRQLLIENFGLDYRLETKPLEVLVLKTPEGEPELPLSESLKCIVKELFGAGPGGGTLSLDFRGCRVGDITGRIERALGKKVFDETTASGRYDFQLTWSLPVANPAPSARQLGQKLRAELVSEVRPTEVLIVDKARRLKKRVRHRAWAEGTE